MARMKQMIPMTRREKVSRWLHWVLIVMGAVSFPLYVVERASYTEKEAQFKNSLHAANAGRWYWNLETDAVFWDDQMFVLLGVDGHNPLHFEDFMQIIQPYDRDRVRKKIESVKTRGGRYEDVFAVKTSKGESRDIRAAGAVYGSMMTGINLPSFHSINPATGEPRGYRLEDLPLEPYPIPGLGKPKEPFHEPVDKEESK